MLYDSICLFALLLLPSTKVYFSFLITVLLYLLFLTWACSSAVPFIASNCFLVLIVPLLQESCQVGWCDTFSLLNCWQAKALNTSCHRPGYIQVALPHPSLAAKSSQSSDTTPCLSLRSQMQLNSLFHLGGHRNTPVFTASRKPHVWICSN